MKKISAIVLFLLTPAVFAASPGNWNYLFVKDDSESYLMKGEGEHDWSKVFHVPENGTLSVTGAGHPIAFIQTQKTFSNFEIQFEFRWPDKPGNSGVQLYSTDKSFYQIWPECIEVQMQHGDVGAFWLLGQQLETKPEQIPSNPDWKNKRERFSDAEKPVGQWNRMRILSRDKTLEVYLNGVLVNRAWNVSSGAGKVTIQAEESNIDYRDFKIRSL